MLILRLLGGLQLHREVTAGTASDASDAPDAPPPRLLGRAVHPVGAPRRKPLAILAVLAARGPRGATREQLAAMLWPEAPAERARHRLAQSIYELRRECGDVDPIEGGAELRLRPGALRTDLEAFESARRAGDFEAAAQAYGGPFLDGVAFRDCAEFDHWVDAERRRLATEHRRLIIALADREHASGELARARRWWQEGFDSAPEDGLLALGLARALLATGDRAGALQTVRAHEELLATHLGAAPDADLTAFARVLREGGTAATPPPAVPLPSATTAPIAPSPPDEPAPPPPPAPAPTRLPPSGVRPRRRLTSRAAIGVLLVAIAAAAGTLAARRSRAVAVEPTRSASIAVLPFRTAGTDSALAYLGEGMVDLLSIAMGAEAGASPHAADARALLQLLPRDPEAAAALPLDSLAALARRVGAPSLLVGEVTGPADRLTLRASLHDARTGARRADAVVSGPADSVAALAERLLVQLLVRGAPEPSARAALLSAAPVAAVRAYLAGQSAYRAGQFVRASAEFERALAADPGLAYAALGLARAAAFTGQRDQAKRGFARALAHQDRLTAADRVYLRALAGPRFPVYAPFADRVASWRAATRTAPQRPDAWYELGDQFLHLGSFLGAGEWHHDAGTAFARAVALDSTFLPALEHLVILATRRGDLPTARRATGAYLRQDSTGETAAFLRWRLARAEEAARERPPAAADADSLPRLTLRWIVQLTPDDVLSLPPTAMSEAATSAAMLLARAASPAERAEAARALHVLALNRGRPAEAQRYVDVLSASGASPWITLRLPVLAALYGDGERRAAEAAAIRLRRLLATVPHDAAGEARRAAATDDEDDDSVPLRERMQAACTLGQWRGPRDTAVARLVDRELAYAARTPEVTDEARACRLLLAVRRDGPAARPAIDSLNAMLDAGVDIRRMFPYVAMATADLHERLGDRTGALRAAGRYLYFGRWPYYLATQRRVEARLALAAGDTARAVCALAHHLALRDAPEPALAAATADAASLLGRLAGRAEPPPAAARRYRCLD